MNNSVSTSGLRSRSPYKNHNQTDGIRVVTITKILWTTPEYWRHQSDCSRSSCSRATLVLLYTQAYVRPLVGASVSEPPHRSEHCAFSLEYACMYICIYVCMHVRYTTYVFPYILRLSFSAMQLRADDGSCSADKIRMGVRPRSLAIYVRSV